MNFGRGRFVSLFIFTFIDLVYLSLKGSCLIKPFHLRYQKEVNELREALNDGSTRMRAADILRGLIDKIVLNPKAGGKEYAIGLHDDLAGILTVAAGKQQMINESDPMLQQVRMMTETGDHDQGIQDNFGIYGENRTEIFDQSDPSSLCKR